MSWVCPVCSTNNEDSESRCIVCDSERISNKICTLTYTRVQKLKLSGNVVVPDEFNVIGEAAFKGRTDIYSITIHNKVKKISKEAFSGCTNLKSIVCEHKLETVGVRAFADCTSLSIADRVKSEYVAEDAYYVTPKPTPPPPPPPKPRTTPPAVVRPSFVRETSESDWKKTVARVLLLIFSAGILVPLVYGFSSLFQTGIDLGFSTFMGSSILLLFIVSLYFRFTNTDAKEFCKKVKIIPAIIALLVLYVITVVWQNYVMQVVVSFFASALLTAEGMCFVKLLRKKEYKFIAILICFMILNSILLLRMFFI